MPQALGRHIICEAYGCDKEILNDVRRVEKIMVAAALACGANRSERLPFTALVPRELAVLW